SHAVQGRVLHSAGVRGLVCQESSMKWLGVGQRALGLFVVAVVVVYAPLSARADIGFGFGFGAFNYVPSPGNFLNDHALVNAANATRGPVSRPVYAGNPNAFINNVRDNGFTQHFGIEARRRPVDLPIERPYARVTQTSAEQPAPAAASPVP